MMDDGDRGFDESTEFSRNLQNVYETTLNDLPREVMEIVFERLDSFSRKKIERVCKGWMEIIRGVRKFRTHLLIELPSEKHASKDGEPCYCEDVFAKLCHLLKPELKVLHFNSHDLPVNSEGAQSNEIVEGKGIQNIMLALRCPFVELSMVDIVFTGFIIDCSEPACFFMATKTKRIRIIRSSVMVKRWFGSCTLYLEELYLETLAELPHQIVELFLAENGPLTEAQADVLLELRGRLTSDGELNMGRIHTFDDHLRSHLCEKGLWYVYGYNWIAALMTIANGGHISRHTVNLLILIKPFDLLF